MAVGGARQVRTGLCSETAKACEVLQCWERCGVRLCIGFIWLMITAGAYEHDSDLQGYTRCFVGQLEVFFTSLYKGQHVRYLLTYSLHGTESFFRS